MTEVAFYTLDGYLGDRGDTVQGEMGMMDDESGVAELVREFQGRTPEPCRVIVTRRPLNHSFEKKLTEISFVDKNGDDKCFSKIVEMDDNSVGGKFFGSGYGWMSVKELDLRK